MLPRQLLIIAATMVILVTAWGASAYVTDCLPFIGGRGCPKQVKTSFIAHTNTPTPTSTPKRKVLSTPTKKNNTMAKKKTSPTPIASNKSGIKARPSPANSKQLTTKGGLTVYAPLDVKINPPTGPELVPLFGLIPVGALGYLLRQKAKK